MDRFDQAQVWFVQANILVLRIQEEHIEGKASTQCKDEQESRMKLFFSIAQTVLELSPTALPPSLSTRARSVLSLVRDPERRSERAELCCSFGEILLSRGDTESRIKEALELIPTQAALLKSLSNLHDEAQECKAANMVLGLKSEIMVYLAECHLLNTNYLRAMEYTAILESAPTHHLSMRTSYIKLQALTRLGRYEEAEIELLAFVQDPAIQAVAAAGMCGIELVMQNPGSLATAKRAFILLQSRCPSDTILPVMMLNWLLKRRPLPDHKDAASGVDVVIDIASKFAVATVTAVNLGGSLENNNHSATEEQECVHSLFWDR